MVTSKLAIYPFMAVLILLQNQQASKLASSKNSSMPSNVFGVNNYLIL